MPEKIISLENMYLSVGKCEITGFGEEAITIPSSAPKVTDKKGLDNTAWVKQIPKSLQVEVTVNLMANSPSVKVLKSLELTGVITTFSFTWEDIGAVVVALDARVEEVGELKINTEMPEISFKITIKNITEFKGIQ